MQKLVISGSTISVKRPLLELTLKFHNVRIGIAVGLNGILAMVERGSQRWLIAVGKWGRSR